MIYKYMKKYTAKRKYQKNKTRKYGGSNNNIYETAKLRLKKAAAWVNFVLEYARHHGWERFPVKCYEPGSINCYEPGSIKYNGSYVFEDSVNEIHPAGKKIRAKDAMILSKYYWDSKKQEGKRPDLYQQFEEEYQLL